MPPLYVSMMKFTEQTEIAITAFPSSFRAWFKTAVISWVVLCMLMSGFAFIVTGGRLEPMNLLGLLALSSLSHIGAYTLIGIPFFAFFWPQSQSCVWRLKLSLPIGAILGFVGRWLIFSILDSRPANLFSDVAGGCLYGAAYGAVTAFVAWKLKNANNPAHPTAGNVLL